MTMRDRCTSWNGTSPVECARQQGGERLIPQSKFNSICSRMTMTETYIDLTAVLPHGQHVTVGRPFCQTNLFTTLSSNFSPQNGL